MKTLYPDFIGILSMQTKGNHAPQKNHAPKIPQKGIMPQQGIKPQRLARGGSY